MKKRSKVILSIFVVIVVLLGSMFLMVTNGLNEAVNVPIDGIDLSDVKDGDYIGNYDFKRWSTSVDVQVNDHKITSIDVVDNVAMSGVTNCADEVIKRVIEAQDTKVDVVTGATATSKSYLKAIEDALK